MSLGETIVETVIGLGLILSAAFIVVVAILPRLLLVGILGWIAWKLLA